MREDIKELLFGSLLFLFFGLVFALIAASKHVPDGEDNGNNFIISADFGRTDGLHAGDKVRIGGINVGMVTKAELMPDYRVRLTMMLDKDYKIPDDSSITIESDSLMGNKYVEIVPGGDDVEILSGGHIMYSQDSMVLEDLIELVISYAEGKQEQMRKECKLQEKRK